MATWGNLPLELRFQIATYLINDACQVTKPYCQVQRPEPRFYYPNYHPKHNIEHYKVQWTSRSAVISTGLYTIMQADPKMAAVVEHLCQRRQTLPKQELRKVHATLQLVFDRPQAPWRLLRDDPKFIWLLKAENLMREIAILDHLGVVGRTGLEPEEPGEITEDMYDFSIC